MSASGIWNIVVNTPMGNTESQLDLKIEGKVLTGTMTDKDGVKELTEGSADGTTLSWRAKVKKPLPMNLHFTATVDGDSMSGGAKSPFGTAPFTGKRG